MKEATLHKQIYRQFLKNSFNLQSTEKQTSKDAATAEVKGIRFLPLGHIDVRAISWSNNPVAVLVLQHGSPRFPRRLY